ncbi:hypothetical protein LINGRAPRIM_LOCUS3281 [Linum grandiflorum]
MLEKHRIKNSLFQCPI